MPFVLEEDGPPDVISTEEYFWNILVDAYPSFIPGQYRKFRTKLTVNGIELGEVKSYSYDRNETDIAGKLDLELANLYERVEFDRTASIKFEIEEYYGGSWHSTVIVDTDKLASASYNLLNKGFLPADTFSLTTESLLQSRLDIGPLGLVVLYDPAKITLTEEDFITVTSIDGVENLVTLVPIADMKLFDILDYVMVELGFDGHRTAIENEQFRRVDFSPGKPYWATIQDIIGIFEPSLTVDSENFLVVRNGTVELQPDSQSARIVTVDDIESVTTSLDIARFKGTLLTYQERGLGYDYWKFNILHSSRYFGNIVGQWPLTRTEFWVQEFYRNAFPNTPVFTKARYLRKWVDMPFTSIAASIETINTTESGLEYERTKRVWARTKTPASFWIFTLKHNLFPGVTSGINGPEVAYSSAGDTQFVTAFVLVRTEQELYQYLAHPYEADSVYAAYHENKQLGLIIRDTEQQQLDQDFDQPILTSLRSGNLREGQASYWGVTGYNWESQQPLPNRQVIVRTSAQDNLNLDEGEALLPDDFQDTRTGDIGISVIKPITKEYYEFTGGDPTATLIRTLNGGEFSLRTLKALCIRLNRRQFFPGTISARSVGLDLNMEIGEFIDIRVDGREDVSLGIFRVVGYSHSGDEGKPHKTVLTAKQVADSTLAPIDNYIDESFSIVLYSGQTVTYTKQIQCYTGHTLSCEVVADLVVEARHGTSGAWTDIETTPIDLSTWNGSLETFQFRVTAGTVLQHFVRSFRFRIGPA